MRNLPVTLLGTPCKYLVEHSFGVTELPSFFVAQIQQAADLPVAKCLIVLTVISDCEYCELTVMLKKPV